MWTEAVIDYLKYSPEFICRINKITKSGYFISGPRLEPGTSRMRSRSNLFSVKFGVRQWRASDLISDEEVHLTQWPLGPGRATAEQLDCPASRLWGSGQSKCDRLVVDKVTLGQVFLRVLRFCPVNIILPLFHITERRSRVLNTPASYSGGSGFMASRPAIMTEVCRGFPQYLQAKIWVAP
jgi:hypothetical protein